MTLVLFFCIHVPLIEKSLKGKNISMSRKDFEGAQNVNYPFQSNSIKIIYGKKYHPGRGIRVSQNL